MKTYGLQTVFTFGKYKGLSVEEVFAANPSYINFCLERMDHFCLTRSALHSLQKNNPHHRFPSDIDNRIVAEESVTICIKFKQRGEQEVALRPWRLDASNGKISVATLADCTATMVPAALGARPFGWNIPPLGAKPGWKLIEFKEPTYTVAEAQEIALQMDFWAFIQHSRSGMWLHIPRSPKAWEVLMERKTKFLAARSKSAKPKRDDPNQHEDFDYEDSPLYIRDALMDAYEYDGPENEFDNWREGQGY